MLKKVRLRERTYNYSFRGKAQILFSIIQMFRRNFEEFKCDAVSASGFFYLFFWSSYQNSPDCWFFFFVLFFYTILLNVYLFFSLQLIFFFYKDLKPFTVILESKELIKQMSSFIYIYIYVFGVYNLVKQD